MTNSIISIPSDILDETTLKRVLTSIIKELSSIREQQQEVAEDSSEDLYSSVVDNIEEIKSRSVYSAISVEFSVDGPEPKIVKSKGITKVERVSSTVYTLTVDPDDYSAVYFVSNKSLDVSVEDRTTVEVVLDSATSNNVIIVGLYVS